MMGGADDDAAVEAAAAVADDNAYIQHKKTAQFNLWVNTTLSYAIPEEGAANSDILEKIVRIYRNEDLRPYLQKIAAWLVDSTAKVTRLST